MKIWSPCMVKRCRTRPSTGTTRAGSHPRTTSSCSEVRLIRISRGQASSSARPRLPSGTGLLIRLRFYKSTLYLTPYQVKFFIFRISCLTCYSAVTPSHKAVLYMYSMHVNAIFAKQIWTLLSRGSYGVSDVP